MAHLVIFMFVVLAVYIGIQYYLLFSLQWAFNFPYRIKQTIKIFLLLSAVTYFLARILIRYSEAARPLLWYGGIWLGVISISFTVFVIKDLILLFLKKQKKLITLGALVVIVIAVILSFHNAARKPVIKIITIPIEKRVKNILPMRIVQIGDLHIDVITKTRWIEDLVKQVNSLTPDIVLITGDIFDIHHGSMKKYSTILKQLQARYGVYAITGNHEFYIGIDRFMSAAKESNITVLRNEVVSAGGIEIGGVDDSADSGIITYRQNAQKVLSSLDPDKVSVFLIHQPNFYKEAAKHKVDLMLAGHTHNGQIPPFNLLVRLEYKYPYGLHELDNTFIYTTSGTGVWGTPMRLFSQSEIVLFDLVNKNQ